MFCGYWKFCVVHIDTCSFYLIGHSTLWWTAVGLNWITLCQDRVPQGSVWGPPLFLLYPYELFLHIVDLLQVLCLMYAVRDQVHPMHHLYCAQPGQHAPLCCRTSQHLGTFIPLSVSLWNDLGDPVFDGMGLACFKSRPNSFLLA